MNTQFIINKQVTKFFKVCTESFVKRNPYVGIGYINCLHIKVGLMSCSILLT